MALGPRVQANRSREVAEAATHWIQAKQALDEVKWAEAKLKKAAGILKVWFRETGHGSIDVTEGTIGYSLTISHVLDLDAVRAELGDRVAGFEKDQERETLSLLGLRK